MIEPTALVEHDDRWLLPFRGSQVEQIRVSHQLILILDCGAEVTIEAPATLTHGPAWSPTAQPVELVPERQDVAAALPLFGNRVLSSVVFKTGSLRLVFDSGLHLNVKPAPDFEAWSVTGPADLRLVCMSAGDLAIWQ
ncbi:hypothetical protein Lfu02_77790 [Longispora fulva]|uniref:Uncharacterized protein n=1 Tax=Longispora fulva TaxID=619741 RepID=A0A8J7GQH6_9ACTN|nr:DUF6188 family protein [Longispora fulva]MBG6136228.1 hypothetical protein [Longispora fulva]GIG63407.1 hypothetical protein Lfu02_77790 [Longispora fulva]